MVGAKNNNISAEKSVVISIDFEMRWGVHDLYRSDFNAYRKNLENCRPVVLATLAMLAARKLRATWATVGALGLNGWDEYFAFAPPAPAYRDPRLLVRKEYAELDPTGSLHFAPDLIERILVTEGQELGSHSFSHLYFREPGVLPQDFIDDMAAVEKLWRDRYGVVPVSLVFPRNQSAFEDRLDDTSIKIWRGSEPAWFYDCTSQNKNTLLPRTLRLVDSVLPIVQRASYPEKKMVRAGIFIRFGLPEAFWWLQLCKLRHELNRLSAGQILHLWWHPHNLGFDLDKGLSRLAQLLDLVSEACLTKQIISKAMKDFILPMDGSCFPDFKS
ncbi:MAG TPA: hypothetical protein VK717_06655 [Opitutaceae bacterium]|jgi:hypothetical protein|nr:hypothetical protein [Opitutaceae bacterium]